MNAPVTDLDSFFAMQNEAIQLGKKDRKHGYHLMQVASLDAQGIPDIRSVVMRGGDLQQGWIRFHTDWRSDKISQFRENPAAAITLYDADSRLQLRGKGSVELHHQNALAQQRWDATRLFSRRCYLIQPGPGAEVQQASSGLPKDLQNTHPEKERSEEGFENFCVVDVKLDQLHLLHLHHEGNHAAICAKNGENWQKNWVVA